MGSQETKTVENDGDVEAFIASIENEGRRADAQVMLDLMGRVTGEVPRMWGSAIVGYGSYHYVYESGREGDMPVAAFSPRKAATTVYLQEGFEEHAALLGRLGPHTTGKVCLYLKRLADVDLGVLEELVRLSYVTTSSRA